MSQRIPLRTQTVRMHAPRGLCFEVVASAGRVVEQRSEFDKIVRFETSHRNRTIPTLERIKLQPPVRIQYAWLEGPLPDAREEISFHEAGGAETDVTYSGWFTPPRGLFGSLIARLYVKRVFERLVREHLHEAKELAERRAARSHVWRSPT